MAVIDLPLTSWRPDLPDLQNPGLIQAHNCTSGLGGNGTTLYPIKAASLYSNTSVTGRPLGTAVGMDRLSNAKVYAGTATKLYKLLPDTRQWSDISRSGGYTTPTTELWKNVEFGSMSIWTNYNDEPQFIDMNVDTAFANLTTLIKGRHIATYKGFVILGNTNDALDGAVPYRVRWSGIEAPSSWDFSPATMADFQDIYGMGNITGIVSDDSCYVLLQRGIVQMSFIGSPYVFSFTDRVTGKGCSVSQSVVTVAGKHFFLSDDGFYCLESGALNPIGTGKIDKWFMEIFDPAQADLMSTAVDPRETLIYWNFVSVNAATGKPDMMLIYNYTTGEWTTADATTHFIFNSMSLPWTLDMLDTYGTINEVPASFDSPIWAGGNSMLWGMSSAGKIYSFSGATLPLNIEFPESQFSKIVSQRPADLATIKGARPLFEGEGTARVSVGSRTLQNKDSDWSDFIETNTETGFAYFRDKSRYHRFKVVIEGEWKKAIGLQIDAIPAGSR